MVNQDPTNPSHALFDQFVQTQTCKEVQRTFSELCHHLQLDPRDYQRFYTKLKERLNYWKAKALWIKLDKRAQHQDYQQGKVCAKTKCLVLGAGPCGLRTAIELALLGAQVVVLEKRDSFSRNNVLHLWPYTIYDLRGLAAKKFYGKFCTGALDHISIRQLQLILLKVSLLLGVDVNTGVEFKGFVEPSEATGWMAKLYPDDHPAGKFQFDVFISAGGGRFVPDGFRWKELRGKLAIGITCNFINHHSAAEAQVAEISGVARIYNQKFFQDLLTEKGIDLENIVYYKDATHYFVMTAKKKSLLKMGVIKQDFSDANQLLGQANVDQDALLRYAHGAAHFSTGHRLPNMQFALNHAGQPDVAMFDFTCMHRAENASLVRERKGKKLLMGLVGDCLVEPFWPLGTGIARGFLAAFDTAWMVRSWGKGKPHLEVIAERESIYQLLSQTTPENISKNYSAFSIDPTTRYQHVNLNSIKTNQLQHLYDVEDHIDLGQPTKKQKGRLSHLRQDSVGAFEELLKWCQQHTAGYDRVKVKDLTQSWRSGLALCALINTFRPHLIDMSSLKESDSVHNNQLAFSLLEEELGIPPIISASDMATKEQIDKLSMVLYLTQIHDAFNERTPTRAEPPSLLLTPSKTLSFQAVFFLNKLKHNSLQRRKERLAAETEEKDKRETEEKDKRMRMGDEEDPVAPLAAPEVTPDPELSPTSMNNEECYFCGQRVYVLERISTEGKFFHRSCFTCQQCGTTLRLGSYTFSQHTGKFYCDLHSEQLEIENREQSPSVKDNIGDHEEEKGVNSITSEDPSPCPSEDDEYYLDSGPPKPMEPLHPPSQEDPSSKQPNPVEEPPVSPKPPIDIFIKKGFEDCEVEEEGKEGGEDAPSDPLTPVPKPRQARSAIPNPQTSPPVPKPRTVLLTPKRDTSPAHVGEKGSSRAAGEKGTPKAAPDSRPKPSLRKLQLTDEEKNHLVNLSFSLDSDSETPGSSSCSSSSATAGGPCPPKPSDGQEEEGYWSGGPGAGGHIREHRNRRCFRRKEEPAEGQGQHARVRSKFSPWNLSSPRLGRDQRFSVLNSHPEVHHGHSVSEEDGADDDDEEEEEDELDMFAPDGLDLYDDKFQTIPSDPVEAEKLELLKMRTLDRRAKTCEMQRFHKAQSIQRRLEEIEVTFKELEDKGVVLEQVLRGEEGSGGSPEMIDQWIHLVHQKNALVSEESDLMVASRQLELEDKQSMLEMELRQYMELDDSEKTAEQQGEEDRVLQEMLEVVDMRNSLVSFLDEKRLKEIESDKQQAISLLEAKRHSTASAGAQVHWA